MKCKRLREHFLGFRTERTRGTLPDVWMAKVASTARHYSIQRSVNKNTLHCSSIIISCITTAMSTAQAPHLRSLYRRLLRELPSRQPSMLASPSPMQARIRSSFNSTSSSTPSSPEATDQFIEYLRAQRLYISLLERYNPGMNMAEEQRVRLTARRVGMDLPKEWVPGAGKKE